MPRRPTLPAAAPISSIDRAGDVAQTHGQKWIARLKSWPRVALHHCRRHAGVGVVCSVAYFDPGNWSVDLQAGSEFGYRLLFIVLLAGLMAVILQVMASRLGCVTGLDLATHCRMLLYNRPKHTLLCRWLLLYPLYILCEIAIISTDLAELLGSAIALVLLFPSLPLWAGVLLTASDVLFILALGDPTRGRPVRLFEFLIAGLVAAVFASLIVVIAKVTPDWADTLDGFLPSKTLFKPGGLYTSIGIIGATVMPHGLFLGSSLATQDRVTPPEPPKSTDSPPESVVDMPLPSTTPTKRSRWRYSLGAITSSRPTLSFSRIQSESSDLSSPDCGKGHAAWENNALSFIRAHLYHGIVDIVMSLLGFAVAINSLILILAGAVFFYGTNGPSISPASLFEAHDLIKELVGKPAALLFALSLLCAGQSASITATLAGQIVSEGFLRWHISPVLRRLITRLIGLLPSMLVAIVVGREGINTLLVASQVALSIVLPFVALPLVWLTSSPAIMRVRLDATASSPTQRDAIEGVPSVDVHAPRPTSPIGNTSTTANEHESFSDDKLTTVNEKCETLDYSNGKIMMGLGYAIWLAIVVANGYVVVTLAMGKGA